MLTLKSNREYEVMNVVTRSILICTTAWSLSASAQEPEQPEKATVVIMKPTVSVGLTFGVDNHVEVEYETDSSAELKVGDLLDLRIGLLIDPLDYPVTIQTTIGYNFDSVTSENGEASLTRLPLELLAFYNMDKHRMGAGLSYHVNPALKLEFDDVSVNADADNAFGLVLEYGYDATDSLIIGLRYLNIDYDFEGENGELDGSQIGIYGYLIF